MVVGDGVGDVDEEGIEAGVEVGGPGVGEVEELDAGFEGVAAVDGDVEAGTEVESHINAAGIGDGSLLGEGEQAAVDVEDRTIAPVVVRKNLQAEGATAAVGVFARAVNIIGIDGDGFEIEIVVERGVMEFDEVGSEARTDDGQALAGKIAEDEGIAEGLAGVDGELVDIAEERAGGGG